MWAIEKIDWKKLSLTDLRDNKKRVNKHISNIVPNGKERPRPKKVFEEISENFPNLVKGINLQIQEAGWIPSKINAKKSMSRHIIIKLLQTKDKGKLLKVARDKPHTN